MVDGFGANIQKQQYLLANIISNKNPLNRKKIIQK